MNGICLIICRRSISTTAPLAVTPYGRLKREVEFVTPKPSRTYNNVTTYENVVFPPPDMMRLPLLPPVPTYDTEAGEKKHKQTRRNIEARGEELIHTELTHRQYGLRVVDGGFINGKQFAFLQERINKCLKPNQFAIWRVDAPWLPRTKKPKGTKQGGGKGNITHYVTPVRSGRILLEVGGYITEMEARGYLEYIPGLFSFKIEFISQQLLDDRRALEKEIEAKNENPFDWDTVLKYNMQNCYGWLAPYDIIWKCKYK